MKKENKKTTETQEQTTGTMTTTATTATTATQAKQPTKKTTTQAKPTKAKQPPKENKNKAVKKSNEISDEHPTPIARTEQDAITQKKISLAPLITALTNLTVLINKKLFNYELKNIVITLEKNKANKRVYGYYETKPHWAFDGVEEKLHQITISTDCLKICGVVSIVGTLVHELVHAWNGQQNIKDTSARSGYHNENYKKAALAHGLNCEKNEKHGWSLTELNDDARKELEKSKEWAELEKALTMNKDKEELPERKAASSKNRSIKYVCPSCGRVIRANYEIKVMCCECQVLFEPQTKEEHQNQSNNFIITKQPKKKEYIGL